MSVAPDPCAIAQSMARRIGVGPALCLSGALSALGTLIVLLAPADPVGGMACLVAAVFWELRAPDPVIDFRLLKIRNFAVANVFYFVFGFGLFASTTMIPPITTWIAADIHGDSMKR